MGLLGTDLTAKTARTKQKASKKLEWDLKAH